MACSSSEGAASLSRWCVASQASHVSESSHSRPSGVRCRVRRGEVLEGRPQVVVLEFEQVETSTVRSRYLGVRAAGGQVILTLCEQLGRILPYGFKNLESRHRSTANGARRRLRQHDSSSHHLRSARQRMRTSLDASLDSLGHNVLTNAALTLDEEPQVESVSSSSMYLPRMAKVWGRPGLVGRKTPMRRISGR
jgi:hypothetical protein